MTRRGGWPDHRPASRPFTAAVRRAYSAWEPERVELVVRRAEQGVARAPEQPAFGDGGARQAGAATMSGNATSSRTSSGASVRVSASADAPSVASPTTSNPSASSSARANDRKPAWSSTIRTVAATNRSWHGAPRSASGAALWCGFAAVRGEGERGHGANPSARARDGEFADASRRRKRHLTRRPRAAPRRRSAGRPTAGHRTA